MFVTTLAMHQFHTSVSDPGSYGQGCDRQCPSMLGIELAPCHHPAVPSLGWYTPLSMGPLASASVLVCVHLW
jgi:hypothetical protein